MELLDSLTMHFIPFQLPEGIDGCKQIGQSDLWQHQDISIANNVLYTHVAHFLGSKTPDDAIRNGCIIYSFAPKTKTPLSSLFNNKKCCIDIPDASGVTQEFSFKFCNDKQLNAPKIILYPQASIGILSFGVELQGNPTLDDLMTFNYALHKTDHKQAPLIRIPFDESKWKPKNEGDIHPARQIYQTIHDDSNAMADGYYLYQLRNLLLSDLQLTESNFVNADRTHIFSYVQIDRFDDPLAFKQTFIRILRAQNQKYMVSAHELESDIFTQTFENIYIGSCVEGGAIAVLAPESAPEHLHNFKKGTLLPRYLWIYLLVLIQRHTLLSITAKLTTPNVSGKLSLFVEQLSQMKINTYFTDISDYTQHNAFYKLCGNNLSIRAYLDSVSDKLTDLTSILDRHREEEENRNSKKLERSLALLAAAQIYFLSITFFGINTGFNWTTNRWVQIALSVLTTYFIYEAGKICYTILWKLNRHKK